jgi:hypothetical protein
MAIDLARGRLFVAELENDSVGVVDLNDRKAFRLIADLKRPQGLGYVQTTDTLYVANGGDGSVRLFQGADYAAAGRIDLGEGADNVRVDALTNRVFVGHGSGLAVIDPTTRSKIYDIVLRTNPESFQLDSRTDRIFVNDPTGGTIIVVDRATGVQSAVWRTGNGSNFPMALDEGSDRVLVGFRDPAKLVVFSMLTGAPVMSAEICQDVDDIFLDVRRHWVYASCGDGFLDVFEIKAAYRRVARIRTNPGARTSLFVPELDRLFVAVRATPAEPAAIWVFRPTP